LRDDYIDRLVEEIAPTTSSNASYDHHMETQPEQEMTEEEYILAQEEYELQALIAAMEEEDGRQEKTSQHYGSDDEDYDEIFMECMDAEASGGASSGAQTGVYDPDAMDMTDG
jgi:hypothetical protein